MDEQVYKNPKITTLLDFPGSRGGVTITEHYGRFNELAEPQYNLRLDGGPGKTLEVNGIPPKALAQIAFRLLRQIKDHVPEAVLERMFEQELGPL